MKSSILIILSMLLALAILSPSVITLTGIGENTAITIDFNEEEKKEEKKEAKEKDFFLDHTLSYLAGLQNERVSISHLYIEGNYFASLAIFLRPPRT